MRTCAYVYVCKHVCCTMQMLCFACPKNLHGVEGSKFILPNTRKSIPIARADLNHKSQSNGFIRWSCTHTCVSSPAPSQTHAYTHAYTTVPTAHLTQLDQVCSCQVVTAISLQVCVGNFTCGAMYPSNFLNGYKHTRKSPADETTSRSTSYRAAIMQATGLPLFVESSYSHTWWNRHGH